MTAVNRKPRVEFRSSGESGNTLHILCLVRDALRKQRRIQEYNDLRDSVLNSGSYTEALAHMRESVNLIDLDGRY
jgi:hypothetical protein